MLTCFKCLKELSLDSSVKLSRTETCPSCLSDLHCCKMCLHWDKNSYNECRESMAERQVDKEKANFCDYFKIQTGAKNDPEAERRKQLEKAMSLLKK